MKIKLTWEGSGDGDERVVLLDRDPPQIWVFVEGPDGDPADAAVELDVTLRSARRPFGIGRHVRGRAGEAGLRKTRSPLAQPSFVVEGLPRAWFPYWLHLTASLRGKVAEREVVVTERANLYVVPLFNRALSYVFVGLVCLAGAYCAWLLARLSAARLPDGISSFGTTTFTIIAAAAGFVGPFLFERVRRALYDCTWTGLTVGLALLLALGVNKIQKPVYFENVAAAAVNLRKELIVEAGDSIVLPRERLDQRLSEYLSCMRAPRARDDGESDDLPQGGASGAEAGSAHVCTLPPSLKAANLCLLRDDSESQTCTELHAAGWIARLQRWLSLGETVRIGCRSVGHLSSEYLEEWKASGSCKRDTELTVTHSLRAHLQSLGEDDSRLLSCVNATAEVKVRPFRGGRSGTDELRLGLLNLYLPGEGSGSLPRWRFSGNAKVDEVSISVAPPAGTDCASSEASSRSSVYGEACDGNSACAKLYAPPDQISASLERGEQKLGTLWCALGNTNIFAVKLRSRLVSLRVLEDEQPDANRTAEVVSRYEATVAGLGEWVFWCEPPDPEAAFARDQQRRSFTAEVTLANDWQPHDDWTWSLPSKSRVQRLSIHVQEHGHWGTLECPRPGQAHALHLLRGNVGDHGALTRATYGTSVWQRYSETQLYPGWVWFCSSSAQDANPMDGDLTIVTSKGQGTLDMRGRFSPSAGIPCLIDPISKRFVRLAHPEKYNEARRKQYSAASVLSAWPEPKCDPARSYLSPVED